MSLSKMCLSCLLKIMLLATSYLLQKDLTSIVWGNPVNLSFTNCSYPRPPPASQGVQLLSKKYIYIFFQMLSVYLILSLYALRQDRQFHRYWGPMTWRSQAYVRGKCNNQVKVNHESLPVRALWESELFSRVKQTWWIPISYCSPLPGTSSSCLPISPNPTNYSGLVLMPKSHLLWEAFLYPTN